MRKIFFATLLLLFSLNTQNASAKRVLDLFTPKRTTPQTIMVDNISKPETFAKSNNLTRKPGSFNVATGEPLYIEGTITDAFGVPVSGAMIKIWQTNASGKYQNLLQANSEYIDPNFTMSGEAFSDNLGNYGFLTIFPGFYRDRAPHINIIISHENFGTIETEIYFAEHPKNETDPHYLSYEDKDRELITAQVNYVNPDNKQEGKIAIFNITMDGIHQYKGF